MQQPVSNPLPVPGLVDLLVAAGRIAPDAAQRARRLQASARERADTILTRLGIVTEAAIAETLANSLGLKLASRPDLADAPPDRLGLADAFLRTHRVWPIGADACQIRLATVDPLDPYPGEAVRFATGREVELVVATASQIEGLHARHLDRGAEQPGVDAAPRTEDVERLQDLASDAPVVRIVHALIGQAVEARASDIHLEPVEAGLRVRLRIDGVLREIDGPPPSLRAAIVSRIKVMAKLDIAEKRLSQDGRLRFAVRGQEVDFRVSTAPTIHGESVVLRVLDRGSLVLDFVSLGFDPDLLPAWHAVLDRPHGIVLVTGPTGSGKTTTLYTSLLRLNTTERKILTIEDPIEYQLQGVNQTQVKPQIGLHFAAALRSFLRQDPDVMMIGEIRDLETAQIAVQAALTGHLILSTLHTNDAASAITRLLDMGVEPFLIPSTLNAVLGQRLVRRLCPHCRSPYRCDGATAEALGLHQAGAGEGSILYAPIGCEHCTAGFRGRAAIVELLPVSPRVGRLALARADAAAIQEAATAEGMRTLWVDGLRKALAGVTTPEEVLRVVRDA